MSDQVTNVDIEDVLSSIRRLVSSGPEKGGEASEDVSDENRLVLTPSQRVDDAVETQATDADVPPDRATAESVGVTKAHPPEIEEPEPLVPALSDDGPDETGGTGTAAPGVTDKPDDPVAEPAAVAETEDSPDLDGIAAMFARHEAAAPSAWEPDGDDEDAFADGAEAPALDWRDAGLNDNTSENTEDERHEAGMAQSAESAASLGHDRDADAHDDDENAFSIEDEAVLDEAALRDLVAEIVREELMGSLGERITRNVRKLVRREIHRALNSQDFD